MFFIRFPAITRNAYGKGTLTYECTKLSDKLQEKLMREILTLAGVSLSDSLLPAPVKVKHAESAAGEPLHFYLNFSGQPQAFIYAYENGIDILTGQPIKKSQKITLAPWDLIIIKVR
jgi:beta-galactosidase